MIQAAATDYSKGNGLLKDLGTIERGKLAFKRRDLGRILPMDKLARNICKGETIIGIRYWLNDEPPSKEGRRMM